MTSLITLSAFFCLFTGCMTAPERASLDALPTCLAPPVSVFIAAAADWPEQIRRNVKLRPEQLIIVPYSATVWPTPWTTDQWMFVWRNGAPMLIDFPGERGLTEWGAHYAQKQHWAWQSIGSPRDYPDSRFDAGGNILVVPGNSSGRQIIVSAQIQPAIKQYLQRQAPAGLIELDTAWLKVGHVDEIVGFVPFIRSDATASPATPAADFRLLLPDYLAGLRLLASVPAETVLFAAQNGRQQIGLVSASGARFIEDAAITFDHGRWKYIRVISGPQAGLVAQVHHADGHRLIIEMCWDLRGPSPTLTQTGMRDGRCDAMPIWHEPPERGSRFVAVEDSRQWLDGQGEEVPAVITAGELARDQTLHSIAMTCARRIDGPGGLQEILSRKLNLIPAQIIKIPMVVRGDADGRNVTALIPNPINQVCLEHQVVLLKPFGPRSNPRDEASDVFLSSWRQTFQTLGLTPVFLDGWNTLHRVEGGVHCGMNVLRQP